MTRKGLPIAFLLVLAAPALAGGALGFSRVADSAQVTLASLRGRQTLIAFWRSDCPPCVAERPMIAASAAAHPGLHVVLVTLDGTAYDERHFPAPAHENMEVWAASQDTQATLHAMGDGRMALPFSEFLHADGSVCDRHYGLLGTETVDEWVKQC